MRATDLLINEDQDLFEINMSPTGLRRAASQIGARAGMEFEMIVPGAAQDDEDEYPEPDYDSDESVNSIQDAYDFFYDGDYNSRRDCDRLREAMSDAYQEWLSEEFSSRWDSDQDTFIYNYLKENASNDEIAEILGREDDDEDTKDNYGRVEVSEAVEKIIEEGSGNYWYDQAYDDAQDSYFSDSDREDEWLESVGIETMQDVANNYTISWPHYYTPSSGGEVSVEDTADSFGRAIGRPVEASSNYHSRSVTRPSATELHYIVEPDGSLEADEPGDGGLEFVSPALPLDELLSDLKKVEKWAAQTGCYTNDSTGLHINVSVPKWQGGLENLDYVKLAILMGDEYVLDQFGRAGNTYCKSALKIVKDNIKQRPEDVKLLLDKMKGHLNTSAAKLIHSGSTSKYTSINTKDGYIEFRSPGGDWLGELAAGQGKIENTLLRFAVAMDAAVDETKYKEEYAKKLYKLLAGNESDRTNTLAYFARYAAGEMPQSALKSFIKQAQLERSLKKEPNGKKLWWSVGRPGYGASVNVVATNKQEAIEKGRAEYPDWANATNITATPLKPYIEPTGASAEQPQGPTLGGRRSNPDGNWVIVNNRAPRTPVYRYMAFDNNDALLVLRQWIEANRGSGIEWNFVSDPNQQLGQPGQSAGITDIEPDLELARTPTPAGVGQTDNYKIIRRADGSVVHTFQAGGAMQAGMKFDQWLEQMGGDRRGYALVPTSQTTPTPGSTTDLAQQRAAGGAFTGAWRVLVDGEEVYRFSGIGNNQSDANRVAVNWLRDHDYEHGTDVEVVPIMS